MSLDISLVSDHHAAVSIWTGVGVGLGVRGKVLLVLPIVGVHLVAEEAAFLEPALQQEPVHHLAVVAPQEVHPEVVVDAFAHLV